MEKSLTVYGELIPPRRPTACWLVRVICPHCNEVHTYGAGIDGTLLGSRSPHCRKREHWERGHYDIVIHEEGQ
jgi:hypothetical protein